MTHEAQPYSSKLFLIISLIREKWNFSPSGGNNEMKVKKDFSRSMCHHHLTVSKPNSKCSSTLFPLTPKCHCSLLTTTQICPCLSIRSNTVLFTSSFVHSLTLQISTEHLLHASTVLETSYNHEQKQRRRSQLSGCFIVIVGEGRGNTETSG